MTKQIPGLNPFLPFSTYIPDGEPKLFGDRLYLYGSYDLFGGAYCSRMYHVVSAPLSDLTAWSDHGVCFSTDEVPWSDALLYAPDALFHNGKYYLFFCMSDGSEGVAQSDCPAGPFTQAKQITLNGRPIEGIDPSVLIDDGRIYYTWGQFHLNIGELEDDFCTLKPDTVRRDVLSNDPGREGFHEASSLRKIGRYYCIIYASEYTPRYPNHGGRPTKLDYATSDSAYGPYRRRGTVIDNAGCDPASWNNHGSVIKANGEWFVFYHASSNNCAYSRRARAERLSVDEKTVTIRQAEPTTNGFLKTLLPEHIVSPVNACLFFGGAYVTQTDDGRFPCVSLKNGSGFEFSPIRFQNGEYLFTLCYRAYTDAAIILYLNGEPVVNMSLPAGDSLRRQSALFFAKNGPSPMRVEIRGRDGLNLCEIDALKLDFIT